MRILQISDVYLPRICGVSTSIATFRDALAERDCKVTLIAPAYPDARDDDPLIERIPSSAVPGDAEDRRMHWSALSAKLYALDRTLALKGKKFDLVHVLTPFVAHYAGVKFARSMRIPAVGTYHTFFEEYFRHYYPLRGRLGALPQFLTRTIARALTRSQARDLAAMIAPSQAIADVLAAYRVRAPVTVIPTGLPPEAFTPGDGTRFRWLEGIPGSAKLLLYAGRVAHEKNVGFLLRVLERLKRIEPKSSIGSQVILAIAGDGPARRDLEGHAAALGVADSVHWCGYLSPARLRDAYAAADAFVFASVAETQGLVLMEAMAARAPIIALSRLGSASVLEGSGALLARHDEADFAVVTAGLLKHPSLAAVIRARQFGHARKWSSAAMAGRLQELYSRLCDRRAVLT